MHLLSLPFFLFFPFFFLFFLFFSIFSCAQSIFCVPKASFMSCSVADSLASITRSQGTKMLRLGASQHNWKLVWLDLPRKLLGWNEHEWSFSLLSHPYKYGWPSSIPFCPISAPTVIGCAYRLVLSSIPPICLVDSSLPAEHGWFHSIGHNSRSYRPI